MKDSARSNRGQGAVAILSDDYRRNPPWRPSRISTIAIPSAIRAWQSRPWTITLDLGNSGSVRLAMMEAKTLDWHATTILSVRKGGQVAVGGDGQVTLGSTVMKADAVKVRKLLDGQVLVGFAGSAADGFALLERLETKLRDHPGNLLRAATELAKLWRTDRLLRRLEAMLVAVDKKHSLLLSGSGDVIQPTDGILCAGSGGGYALAAARALIAHTDLSAGDIVRRSLQIAGGIDIYTNGNLTVEELASDS